MLLTVVLTPDCIAHFMLLLMACFHQCPRLTRFNLQPFCVCVSSTTLFYSEVAIIEELYWKAVSKKVNSAFAAALILFPFSCTWEYVLSTLVDEGNEVQEFLLYLSRGKSNPTFCYRLVFNFSVLHTSSV